MHDERLARLADWAGGRPRGPHTLELGLTMACNADCAFCWRQHPDTKLVGGTLSAARWREVLDEAHRMDVRYVRVIGEGEPLLHPEAPEVLRHVKRLGIRSFLCSNGTLFTRELIHDLVSFGWDWVSLSVEGPDAATHDALVRMPGAFERIVWAARQFARVKRGLRSDRPGLNFGMALTTRNWRRIADTLTLAAEAGVHAVNLEPITVNSPESVGLKLDRDQARAFVEDVAPRVVEEGRRLGVRTNAGDLSVASILSTNRVHLALLEAADRADGLLRAPCFNPFWFLHLRANGQVGSCGFWRPMHGERLGSQSLEAVWHGDYFQRMRAWLLGGRLFDVCSDCNLGFVEDTLVIRTELADRLAGRAFVPAA
jgi:MoaA/NifB/PqqE/SkfB family radical SAM enzyme